MRTPPRPGALRRAVSFLAVIALAGSSLPAARADIDEALTKKLWGMHFNVPTASLDDPNWLLLDDDSDGISNGAELVAGTDPKKGDSTIKISNIAVNGTGDLVFSFPAMAKKKYFLQSNHNLSLPANWADVSGASVTGVTDGETQTLTVPSSPNTFYRVRVVDVDSDGDQVSDWAEKMAGYNPALGSTDGRTSDHDAIVGAVSSLNQVTISAVKPSATQPGTAQTPPVETGSVIVSRGLARLGAITAPAISVSLQKIGTAVEGTDYLALPASVDFPAGSVAYQAGGGVTETILSVVPKYNGARRTNVTAIVKAMPGAGYTVGAASSGGVVVNPAGINDGTGLTANYYIGSSTTYANQSNFGGGTVAYSYTRTNTTSGTATVTTTSALAAAAQVKLQFSTGPLAGGTYDLTYTIGTATTTTFTVPITGASLPASGGGNLVLNPPTLTRIDPTINFAPYNATTNPSGWGAGSNGTLGTLHPITTPNTSGAGAKYTVRWTGQILPQYSETYTIAFRSDDGARVWVNNKLLIDRWVSQGANDYSNTIDLKANVLYDIRIEYLNVSGAAEARLYWWSLSQPKEIIPQTRLFPEPAQGSKTTAVTNNLALVGYVGQPLTYYLATPNIGSAVTYAIAPGSRPLPTNLTLDSATGKIAGTPDTAGTFNVAIDATNVAAGTVTGSSILNITIFPGGSVTREILGANGAITADGTVPTLDDDTDYADNTARRLRGYLIPPKTGNYYFWLAANNSAELWISNDSEAVSRVRRAFVTSSTGKKVWNAASSQRTDWIALEAGTKYYFDVLHNTGTDADDYLAVGWCQDDFGTIPSATGAPNATGVRTQIPNGGAALQGFPYSGTTPGFIFQPYDYPSTATVAGALYSANLGPQGSSATKASGFANVRLENSASPTFAILHFDYQGLTTPRTAYHLHVDAHSGHPQGEIVYDIDDIDAFHPELRTADGGYVWNFTTGGTFSSVQQIRDAITQGKVYLNVHTVDYPAGEIRGTLTLVEGSQTPPDPAQYPEPTTGLDQSTDLAGAARFLNQATFGASPSDVAKVQSVGFNGWIDEQLTLTPSRTSNDVVAGLTSDINQPYPSRLFTDAWWKYSISAPDQLRQRLAFALSEILVVSWANDTGPLQFNGRILADYYDNLIDYALPLSGLPDSGNFRGVLKAVTLTPAMGLYLDMRANQKEDITIGRHPNENYARELMQLFSVGINRMWDDGRFVLNSNADIVPVYTQPTILGLSALLTGWNYAQPNQGNGRLPTNFGPGADYLNPMVLVPTRHDMNAKLLLNNVVTPAATGQMPRVTLASVSVASPAVFTTSTAHGLSIGDTVYLANVTGGAYSATINAAHVVTKVNSATTFETGVNCTTGPTSLTNAIVTGPTVTAPAFIGAVTPITGSQADNSGTTTPHPYDQYGLTELEVAINNIMANDNVAPYICRQLIQRFVTSNPSPGYLYRVVQKFKNNGSGVRGDLAAVVRQILTDGEARSATAAATNDRFGKQREPMLRLTGAARAFPSQPYTGTYTQLTGINANRLRIVTSNPNDFSPGFSFALDFRGNYTTTVPPNPSNNPTSTTYSVNSTLGIASTWNDIVAITPGATTIVTTANPHGLSTGNTVTLSGVSGTSSPVINGTFTATVNSPTSFTISTNTTRALQVTSVAVGNPCVITAPGHGLSNGNLVTLNGINGGSFSATINNTFAVSNVTTDTFTVPVNCTLAPTSLTTWRHVSNPARITTAGPHGLTTGDTITLSGVSGGNFSPTVNNTFSVAVIDANSFTVPVNCTAPATANTGSIVGGNTLDVTATGMVNVTYTQVAGSNVMTVNTAGPQTNVAVPNPNSATTTLKSKVYLDFVTVASSVGIASIATGSPCVVTTSQAHGLTTGNNVTFGSISGGAFSPTLNGNTYSVTVLSSTTFSVTSNCTTAPTAGTGTISGTWLPSAADGIYAVDANPNGSSFTVLTADTPAGPRSGNVIIPRIPTSYTPVSGNNVVQYNTNVNHNLVTGDRFWVDVPIVGSPVIDAEYTVTTPITGSGILPADEDHLQTSYLPVTSGLSTTFPKPSGSNNGITIWPLVAPPMGRSGTVKINQSTFILGPTESTLAQSPLNAPTVFNYFFPDYKFPGALSNTGTDSPEFQLTTDSNVSNITNSLTNMFIGTGGGNGNVNGLSSFNNGSGSIVMDTSAYLNDTPDANIPGLIDTLSSLLVGGPLTTETRSTILNFVTYKRMITNISQASPCVVTTSAAHGLTTGDQIAISDMTGGSFSGGTTTINNSFIVTVTGPNTFRISTVATTPVAVNCTNAATINYTNANVSNFPMTIATGPTNQQKRDRVRAIIHLIITSAEYAVQK